MVLLGHPWVSPVYSTFCNSVADLFCNKLRTFAVHSGNVKNMCFLNAILQCFYHTPMLRRNLSLACESQKPSPKLHHLHKLVAFIWPSCCCQPVVVWIFVRCCGEGSMVDPIASAVHTDGRISPFPKFDRSHRNGVLNPSCIHQWYPGRDEGR